jgi:2,4-dienoyl-CoA reductase-like NADH-dependent reductase (Old Yellow Enzyme family)/thioredoxin reductase
MERNLCEIDGRVTDRYIAYLEARAAGGAALVQTEASYVRADGKGRLRQMGVHDDSTIPGLIKLSERIHHHGALLGVELNHGGRTSQARISGLRPVAPSPIPCAVVGGEVPIELEDEDIHGIIDAFAAATRRCRQAGVDVLTIHAAHGYLIHQFLSPRTNLRTDSWAEPTRFLDAVIDVVRANAGSLPVGLRVSVLEGPSDGLDPDRTFDLIGRARLDLVDFIDVSAGSYEGREWIVQPGEWPQGLLRDHAARYQAFGKVTGVAGRINSLQAAEEIVAGGQADFVSLARALHADPQWATKVLIGIEPRPCIACNLCIDQLGTGEPIPCTVNPAAGREAEFRTGNESTTGAVASTRPPRPPLVQSALVVGAGPAGLEVARSLAEHGWRVELRERADRLGGQFALASTLHEYPEYGRILDWYAHELQRLHIDVSLGVDVDAASIGDSDAGVVVLATGATGYFPDVEGIDLPRVVDVREWIRDGRRITPGATHTVWGTDREAVAVADDIATRGGRVLLVGANEELAPDVGARAKILVVPRLLDHPAVEVRLATNVAGITERTLVLESADGRETRALMGPVLVSQGVVANTTLLAACRKSGTADRVYVIGDAAGRGGRAAECIADGAELARTLVASTPMTD